MFERMRWRVARPRRWRLLTGHQPSIVRTTLSCLTALTALAAAPLLLASRRRRRDARPSAVLTESVVNLLALQSVAGILLVTLLPTGPRPAPPAIVPFSDVRDMVAKGMPVSEIVVQVVGNVALFAPLGFVVPLAVRDFDSLGRITALATCLAASVEIAQGFLPHGRTASTGDAILNVSGAVGGYMLLRAARAPFRPE